MKFALIKELQPYGDDDYNIRVCVCRLWRGKQIKPACNASLRCVLVDERGDAIHGFAHETDYLFVYGKLKQGEVYNISNFFVQKTQEQYNVVDNAVELRFNARTIFKRLENSLPKIPEHRFYLLEYNKLKSRIDNHRVLTDLFGCLKVISLGKEPNKEGSSIRYEARLQNLRREEVKVILWGDVATAVLNNTQNLPSPVFLVLTSLKIGKFMEQPQPSSTNDTCFFINPDIPQAEYYKIEFCQPGDNLRILANPHPQITAKEVEQKTKITVHELNKLNPQYHKGSISRFSPNEDWWFEACPHCYKQLKLKENSNLRICQEHGMQVPLPCYRMHIVIEDPNNEALLKLRGKPAEQLFGITCKDLINKYHFTTQESLPEEILQTIGQIHIFQIQITDKHELIIKGIFPDKQSSAQQTQYEPTTSTPAQTLHDKKRFSDKNRRELFSNDPKKKSRREEDSESTISSSEQPEDTKEKKL